MIVIIGAGIAGLSLGFNLIKQGQKVTILDQDKIGRGASWAATSYLEPRPGVGKMRRLEWQSVTLWPQFAKAVEEISGMDVDYHSGSQLKPAFEDTLTRFEKEHALRIQGREAFKAHYNAEFEELSREEALNLEPHLSPDIVKAVLLPKIDWLDGRLFCQALGKAIAAMGGTILEQCKATEIKHDQDRIKGIAYQTQGESILLPCEKLILCSGFGTNSIEELPRDVPKSRAIRGVAITYQTEQDNRLTLRLIKHQNGIICPRGDGRLIVGATHEEDEADPIVTDEAIDLLKQSAERTLPALKNLPIVEAVAGIRASIGDGMLRMGQSKEIDGLYYALSQGGAGFLRAAIFGQEFSEFIVGNHDKTQHISPFIR